MFHTYFYLQSYIENVVEYDEENPNQKDLSPEVVSTTCCFNNISFKCTRYLVLSGLIHDRLQNYLSDVFIPTTLVKDLTKLSESVQRRGRELHRPL